MTGVRVAAFGLTSWDELLFTDRHPAPGDYAIVHRAVEQPGGTTANLAVALARLGVHVSLAAMVGDDAEGRRLREELAAAGVDIRHVRTRASEPTDRSTIIVAGEGAAADRTIVWRRGARLRRGDHLPIEEFFAYDLVVVDVDDPRLRRLIVDLSMHVSPRTRLLGPLVYLTTLDPATGLDLALRHDYVVGNATELCYLTGAPDLPAALAVLREEMILSQTRLAAITCGADGCVLVDRDRVVTVPAFDVEVVDPTGAGDAFAAGLALGIVSRWDLAQIGRFANAMGALATRCPGAQAGLPRRGEVERFLAAAPVREPVR
ncbi:MAG: carbohydrate kinase family protein [Sphaerobacter sp.]|nr:carbohydrate kinase family protein [Sphaerobacter sp.]